MVQLKHWSTIPMPNILTIMFYNGYFISYCEDKLCLLYCTKHLQIQNWIPKLQITEKAISILNLSLNQINNTQSQKKTQLRQNLNSFMFVFQFYRQFNAKNFFMTIVKYKLQKILIMFTKDVVSQYKEFQPISSYQKLSNKILSIILLMKCISLRRFIYKSCVNSIRILIRCLYNCLEYRIWYIRHVCSLKQEIRSYIEIIDNSNSFDKKDEINKIQKELRQFMNQKYYAKNIIINNKIIHTEPWDVDLTLLKKQLQRLHKQKKSVNNQMIQLQQQIEKVYADIQNQCQKVLTQKMKQFKKQKIIEFINSNLQDKSLMPQQLIECIKNIQILNKDYSEQKMKGILEQIQKYISEFKQFWKQADSITKSYIRLKNRVDQNHAQYDKQLYELIQKKQLRKIQAKFSEKMDLKSDKNYEQRQKQLKQWHKKFISNNITLINNLNNLNNEKYKLNKNIKCEQVKSQIKKQRQRLLKQLDSRSKIMEQAKRKCVEIIKKFIKINPKKLSQEDQLNLNYKLFHQELLNIQGILQENKQIKDQLLTQKTKIQYQILKSQQDDDDNQYRQQQVDKWLQQQWNTQYVNNFYKSVENQEVKQIISQSFQGLSLNESKFSRILNKKDELSIDRQQLLNILQQLDDINGPEFYRN